MNRLLLVALACMPMACSGDNTAPLPLGVGGRWVYRVDRLSDDGQVNCTMTTQDTLTLDRSAGKLSGRYAGGIISCSGKDVESITMVGGVVVNGTIDAMAKGGQDVTFDLDGSAWHHAGSFTGDRMSGTLTVDHAFAGKLGVLHLTGSWSARRTSVIPPPPPPH